MLVRLGSAAFPAAAPAGGQQGGLQPGTALPVTLEFLDGAGATWLNVSLPTVSVAGRQACTLSFGALGPTSTSYWLDTEGLPSLAGSGDAVVLPCHTSPAGAPLGALLADAKTIAVLHRNGSADTSIRFTGFTGVRGTSTGLRTALTTNGREFWLAGIANSNSGLRYLAEPSRANTTRVHGSKFLDQSPLRYEVGTLDLRGATLWGSQLYVTSSYAVEPNRNMPADQAAYRGYTPWGGVVRVGELAGPLPRAATPEAALARGFDGRRSYWGFTFESPRALWILEDTSRYARAPAAAQAAFTAAMDALAPSAAAAAAAAGEPAAARPVLYRASEGTAVVAWRWAPLLVRWVEDAPRKVYLGEACYSLAARAEPSRAPGGGGPVWVVYTTSRTRLFRVDTAAGTARVLRQAPDGQLFRGVALPPYVRQPQSVSPAVTRSKSPLPSRQSAKPRSFKPRGA